MHNNCEPCNIQCDNIILGHRSGRNYTDLIFINQHHYEIFTNVSHHANLFCCTNLTIMGRHADNILTCIQNFRNDEILCDYYCLQKQNLHYFAIILNNSHSIINTINNFFMECLYLCRKIRGIDDGSKNVALYQNIMDINDLSEIGVNYVLYYSKNVINNIFIILEQINCATYDMNRINDDVNEILCIIKESGSEYPIMCTNIKSANNYEQKM